MKNYSINIRYMFFLLCLYGLTFQNLIQSFFPIFKYFDELLAIISIPIVILNLVKQKNKLNKDDDNLEIRLIFYLFVIGIIGIIGNLRNKYQSINSIFSDIIIFYKFYLGFFLSEIIWGENFVNKFKKKASLHIKMIIVFLLLLTIANYTFNLYSGSIRFGLKSNQLFFTHPTYLASVCVFLLSLNIRFEEKMFSKYTIILLILLLSTLRMKAIGSMIAIIIVGLYIEKTNKKLSLSKLAIIGIIITIFAYDQVNYYFFQNDSFARKKITDTSFIIAKDNFPIGTGFATYGSYYSSVEYSPVYSKYNLSHVYGLSPNYNMYISDTFWPMIIGQFGFAGLIIYLLCIYAIYKIIQSDNMNDKYNYISKLTAFIYIIISSTSESAFAGPIALPLAISIGMYRSSKNANIICNNKNEKKVI